ncbi:hypothetical protein SAMN05444392_102296 [Seinonella peptonophila]|uniref:Uncharacterized protein n=1 Tax=Seinonella peptonophila TaxID=112248 RepID=A0A1M4VD34_9BACL|nr:hypothetical protein [Seinonella peptonophila]SHE66730.1 hypothetical protein SAMN05444392_102296 [Seinonella peptonophila]
MIKPNIVGFYYIHNGKVTANPVFTFDNGSGVQYQSLLGAMEDAGSIPIDDIIDLKIFLKYHFENQIGREINGKEIDQLLAKTKKPSYGGDDFSDAE